MIRVTFTAERNMTGSHVSGESVVLNFSAAELTPGRKVTRDVQRSLSGKRETLLHNAVRTWSVTTEPLAAETLDAMEEFLASVEDGQSFSFEPWRYESGPSLDLDFLTPRLRVAEAITCALESDNYSLTRLIGDGTGGADDWYQVSFTVEESP